MRFILKVCLLLSVGFSFFAFANQKVNYEHFAHLPMISGAKVSPDGKHVAAIFNSAEGPSVVVAPFGSRDLVTIAKLKADRDRIDRIIWGGSNRLLVEASWSESYGKNHWRAKNYYAVNIDGTNLVEIKPRVSKRATSRERRLASRVNLISSLPKEENFIMVQAYDVLDKGQAVFKVNISTNKFEKQFINKYNVNSWFVNAGGEVVFGVGVKENEPEVLQYWVRKPGTEEWKMVNEYKNMAGDTFSPLIIQDGKLWVLSNRELGRNAVWEFDIEKGVFGELVYAHEKYDVIGLIMNGDNSKAIGVKYIEHFVENHYFDEANSSVGMVVANSFAGYKTVIASRNVGNDKLLVMAYKNDSPIKYFWLDVSGRKGGLWFSQYPYIERTVLGKTEAFTYKANDGMELYGYLTMPPGLKDGEKPPLIIHPHGGPFGPRDDQSFSYMVQFMANMGYAVLQPNFRGSGGYGTEYQTAGYKQWGLKMQEDVYDAVDWLKAKGTVDTDNACFVGWSYGGYTALTAAYQKPDEYQCIVSIAGVSDVEALAREGSNSRNALAEFYKVSYGDVSIDAEKAQLKNASAINFVDKIKAPVLLIHGKNDTQVHYTQSSEFYEAADDAGVDVEYVEYKSGTHYLDEYNNRLDAFEHIEDFLKKHLKAK